ncbi:unnamed protein product [Bemisia tabaci]|uniref:Uncharacterized protein n=1 Tax=Bemisia tabaci TaxID=7038 RepID=A0A9P0AK88_BEMTA|nr:unnamed protein product [Bemisia tabaci]
MPADEELSSILNRRQQINDALDEGKSVAPQFKKVNCNVYTEFQEFSRKQIKEYEKSFNRRSRIHWSTGIDNNGSLRPCPFRDIHVHRGMPAANNH